MIFFEFLNYCILIHCRQHRSSITVIISRSAAFPVDYGWCSHDVVTFPFRPVPTAFPWCISLSNSASAVFAFGFFTAVVAGPSAPNRPSSRPVDWALTDGCRPPTSSAAISYPLPCCNDGWRSVARVSAEYVVVVGDRGPFCGAVAIVVAAAVPTAAAAVVAGAVVAGRRCSRRGAERRVVAAADVRRLPVLDVKYCIGAWTACRINGILPVFIISGGIAWYCCSAACG